MRGGLPQLVEERAAVGVDARLDRVLGDEALLAHAASVVLAGIRDVERLREVRVRLQVGSCGVVLLGVVLRARGCDDVVLHGDDVESALRTDVVQEFGALLPSGTAVLFLRGALLALAGDRCLDRGPHHDGVLRGSGGRRCLGRRGWRCRGAAESRADAREGDKKRSHEVSF